MKLSIMLDYAGDPRAAAAEAADLERAGVDVCWVAEAYSFDAVSILGYLAAKTKTMALGSGIVPIYSRTPTLTAMTAAGLDAVSEGRFVLGIGASGPQVIEGWHGVPYDQPIGRQREVIEICRKVWRRETVEHNGPNYPLPLPADRGTGLGKPLKLINYPRRDRIPIYIASMGAKNVELTAELAEGWIPIFFHPEKAMDVWGDPLDRGLRQRSDGLGKLEVVAGGTLAICDEHDAAKLRDQARFATALYVGGMGANGRNFYNSLFRQYGYEEEAAKIQALYLAGHKNDAMDAVPQDFLDATAMVGDEVWVKERINAYRTAGVTQLQIRPVGPDRIGLVERVKGWLS